MIEIVSNLIFPKISGCTWLENWGGHVTKVSKFDETSNVDGRSVGITTTFPVNCGMDGSCFNKGRTNPLIPNSNQKSLLYIEDDGALTHSFQSRKGNISIWTGSIRIIGFLNYLKLGIEDCNQDYLFIEDIISKISKKSKFKNESNYSLEIKSIRELPKNANSIFGRYSFSQKMTNLLLYPYSYFALQLQIELTINNACTPSIEDVVMCEEIKCAKL
jgi:hypothetical protein